MTFDDGMLGISWYIHRTCWVHWWYWFGVQCTLYFPSVHSVALITLLLQMLQNAVSMSWSVLCMVHSDRLLWQAPVAAPSRFTLNQRHHQWCRHRKVWWSQRSPRLGQHAMSPCFRLQYLIKECGKAWQSKMMRQSVFMLIRGDLQTTSQWFADGQAKFSFSKVQSPLAFEVFATSRGASLSFSSTSYKRWHALVRTNSSYQCGTRAI